MLKKSYGIFFKVTDILASILILIFIIRYFIYCILIYIVNFLIYYLGRNDFPIHLKNTLSIMYNFSHKLIFC